MCEDAKGFKQPDCIGGHCRQVVRSVDRLAGHHLRVKRHHVGRIASGLGREANIAIVESDDPESALK
jgi:hypothetical protein